MKVNKLFMINNLKRKSQVLPVNILRRMSEADRKSLGDAGVLPEEAQAAFVVKNERELQGHIAGLFRMNKIWNDRDAMNKKRTGTTGTPDFLLAYRGVPVGIEAKMPGEEPTKDQKQCHAEMRGNGWCIFVVTSLREVQEILRSIDAERGSL